MPSPPLTSPYAPNHLNEAFKIADLIRQQGYTAADRPEVVRRPGAGMIAADLVIGAGSMAMNAIERRDQKRKILAENQKIADAMASGEELNLPELVRTLGLERAKEIVPMVEASLARRQALEDRRLAASEKANEKGMWQMSMDALAQPGADKYKIQQQYAGQTGKTLPLKDLLPDPKEARDLKDEEELAAHVEAINGGANAEAMNRNLLARTGGRVSIPVNMMPKVPEPVKPAARGSFEDYVNRYAKARDLDPDNLSDKHIEEARKLYNQADDRPNITVNTPSPYQEFGMTERLAGAWTKANAPVKEMDRQLRIMRTGLEQFTTGKDTVGGSQAVINTISKMLDAESVVREAEYLRTFEGQSWLNRIRGFIDTAKSGGANVDPSVLKGLVESSEGFLSAMKSYNAGTRRRIESQAKKYNLDPANIFDDLLIGDGTGGGTGDGAGGTGGTGGGTGGTGGAGGGTGGGAGTTPAAGGPPRSGAILGITRK
jgi:hypothetical protein